MAKPEKWIERLRKVTEPHCGEPVLSAAVVQPFGREGARLLTGLSPLAGFMKRRDVDRSATVPEPSIVAVTAQSIHVFEAKPAGLGYRVVREVGSWKRRDVETEVEELKTVYAIALAVRSSGDSFVMEALKNPLLGYRGVAADLVQTLRAPG